MDKPKMTIEDAKTILKSANRHTCADYAFGDSEIYWTINEEVIAEGYDGRTSKSLSMNETDKFCQTTFLNKDFTIDVFTLGTYGSFHRNDSQHN